MVYNIENHLYFGLYPSSWIKYKNIKITTFRKMALLPSSGDAYSDGPY